jgi:hypothetical protein
MGEKPIQGYTNFGWTLYMGLLHLLPFPVSKISLVIMITGLLILLTNVIIVKRIAQLLFPDLRMIPALATVCTAFNFPLVYWSLRGMEVGLVCLLISVLILISLKLYNTFLWKQFILFALISFFTFLVRIDSLLQIGILSLFIGASAYKSKKLPQFFIISCGLVLLMFFYILAQKLYFGDFLPNSYYLKVTGVSILERLSSGITFFIKTSLFDVSLYLLIILYGFLFLGRKAFDLRLTLLLSLFVIQCIYSIYVGGDFAENSVGGANRFITQGICPLIMAFSMVVYKIVLHLRSLSFGKLIKSPYQSLWLFLFLSFSTVFLTNGQHWITWVKLNAPMLGYDTRRAKIGVLVNSGTDKNARIASHSAGQIPYYSKRYSIDLLGKNDAVIAKGKPSTSFYPGHNKWNYNYSIGQLKPDVIADEWGESPGWLEIHKDEYERLPNGIWIRKNSLLINKAKLSKIY